MNHKLFFFAYALILFYSVTNLLASPIIGGHEDTLHTYKYHVSVQFKHNPRRGYSGKHNCGGAIIHDKYVLSVAHCFMTKTSIRVEKVYPPRSTGIKVLGGTSKTYGRGIVMDVVEVFIPHIYNQNLWGYGDISVLKLRKSLDVEHNSNTLQILELDPGHFENFFINKNALIVGNGCDTLHTDSDGAIRPLLKASKKRYILEVVMIESRVCLYEHTICAVSLDRSHICTVCDGDGGSPLVFENTIIGVVVRGPRNCDNNINPIKSTRVSKFMYFITNAMNEDGDHSEMHKLSQYE